MSTRCERPSRNVSASRRGVDPPPPGAVVVALLLAAGGVFCGIIALRHVVFDPLSAARRSANWVDTPCTVVRHACVEGGRTGQPYYTAQAWYQYYFEGKLYEAHQLHFGHEGEGKSFSGQYGRSRAMKHVQQTLPLKLELRCYVNPADPEQAVIERKAVYSWFFIGLGVTFMLAGVGIASYITYTLIQERRRAKGNGE